MRTFLSIFTLLLSAVMANAQAAPYIVNEDIVRRTEFEVFDYTVNEASIAVMEEWFDGTREINGQTYHDLHVKYDYKGKTEEYITAYMREENGSVYSIIANEIPRDVLSQISDHAYLLPIIANEEANIYTFNIAKGEEYNWFINQDIANDFLVTSSVSNTQYVTAISNETFSSRIFKKISLESYYKMGLRFKSYDVYEGFGYIGNLLCFPGLVNVYETPTARYVKSCTLYDKTGNLIAKFGDTEGLQDVTAVAVRVEGKHIVMPEAGAESRVEVYNVAGVEVLTASGADCKDVDLSQLDRGIYIVTASDGKHTSTLKVSL